MTLTNLRTHRPAKYPGLTDLNLATSKAYAACAGRHTPSGETVRWSSGSSRARGPRLP